MTETELSDVDRDRERIRALQLERSTTLRARLMRWRARRKKSSLKVTDDLEAAKVDDSDTGFSRMMAGVAMTGPIRVQRGTVSSEVPSLKAPSAWAILVYFPFVLRDIIAIAKEARRSQHPQKRRHAERPNDSRSIERQSSVYGGPF